MLNHSSKDRKNRIKYVENALRNLENLDAGDRYALIYVAYLCKENGIYSSGDFARLVLDDMPEERRIRRHLFVSKVIYENWDSVQNVSRSLSAEDMLTFLKYWDGDSAIASGVYAVPASEAALLGKLLEIKNDSYVAALGCGVGTFAELTGETAPTAKYYGLDFDTQLTEISLIKCELFGLDARVDCKDTFAIDDDLIFDKIIADPSFGIGNGPIFPLFFIDNDEMDGIMSSISGMNRATMSFTWPIAALMLKHLKKRGRAIEVVAMGGLSNEAEKEVRKHFVENHFISAVIALPQISTTTRSIQTALIIFERNQRDFIRMIDAREQFVPGRRQNSLSETNINEIVKALYTESENAKSVSFAEIQNYDYALNPEIYFQKKIAIRNGVELGTVARITRGVPIKASQLDEMVSDVPTNTQYLKLADIQNGMIKSDLSYLKDLDEKYEKYLVHDKNIILSKTGSPFFKTAIARIADGNKVIGSGNLYIIEADESKLNPYFLEAFLESETGMAVLKQASRGTVLSMIPLKSLRHIMIPLPPMDVQEKIAKDYQLKVDEVKTLTKKLEKAQNELKQVYKEEDNDSLA